MVGSKAWARKTQVEPGSACGTESKEVIKKNNGLIIQSVQEAT